MVRNVSLIIPAAGLGRRMESDVRKPFLTIAGRPILHLTLERFLGIEGLVQTIVAINGSDYERKDAFLAETAPLGVTSVVKGGATRTESVRNALAALAPDVEIVLIHDAVRPFVGRALILAVIEETARVGAAIAAVPVKDTVKRVAGGLVAQTVPRSDLYLAQTPQGFRRELIESVYASIGEGEFTDDAGLVEAAGGQVAVVRGSYDNFKITTPEDLARARRMLGDCV